MSQLRYSPEDWKRRRSYLTQTLFQDFGPLYTIREESEEVSLTSPRYYDGRDSPIPELIIEVETKPNLHDETEEFYQRLEKIMLRLYRKDYLNVDDSISSQEFLLSSDRDVSVSKEGIVDEEGAENESLEEEQEIRTQKELPRTRTGDRQVSVSAEGIADQEGSDKDGSLEEEEEDICAQKELPRTTGDREVTLSAECIVDDEVSKRGDTEDADSNGSLEEEQESSASEELTKTASDHETSIRNEDVVEGDLSKSTMQLERDDGEEDISNGSLEGEQENSAPEELQKPTDDPEILVGSDDVNDDLLNITTQPERGEEDNDVLSEGEQEHIASKGHAKPIDASDKAGTSVNSNIPSPEIMRRRRSYTQEIVVPEKKIKYSDTQDVHTPPRQEIIRDMEEIDDEVDEAFIASKSQKDFAASASTKQKELPRTTDDRGVSVSAEDIVDDEVSRRGDVEDADSNGSLEEEQENSAPEELSKTDHEISIMNEDVVEGDLSKSTMQLERDVGQEDVSNGSLEEEQENSAPKELQKTTVDSEILVGSDDVDEITIRLERGDVEEYDDVSSEDQQEKVSEGLAKTTDASDKADTSVNSNVPSPEIMRRRRSYTQEIVVPEKKIKYSNTQDVYTPPRQEIIRDMEEIDDEADEAFIAAKSLTESEEMSRKETNIEDITEMEDDIPGDNDTSEARMTSTPKANRDSVAEHSGTVDKRPRRKRAMSSLSLSPINDGKVDKSAQNSFSSDSVDLSSVWNNFFVGIPSVYKLCTCRDHACV